MLLAAGADPAAMTTVGYTALRMLEEPDKNDRDDPWSTEATAEVIALLRAPKL